ncbi:hypothetical protein Ciccas_011657, partial [Cichlidogyrus casuarinus]
MNKRQARSAAKENIAPPTPSLLPDLDISEVPTQFLSLPMTPFLDTSQEGIPAAESTPKRARLEIPDYLTVEQSVFDKIVEEIAASTSKSMDSDSIYALYATLMTPFVPYLQQKRSTLRRFTDKYVLNLQLISKDESCRPCVYSLRNLTPLISGTCWKILKSYPIPDQLQMANSLSLGLRKLTEGLNQTQIAEFNVDHVKMLCAGLQSNSPVSLSRGSIFETIGGILTYNRTLFGLNEESTSARFNQCNENAI